MTSVLLRDRTTSDGSGVPLPGSKALPPAIQAFFGKAAASFSGKAVCTGHANLGTALFLARGIPARVLACLPAQAKLQEHYISEIWTPQTEWLRVEATSHQFPLKDSEHLILRVVYPDSYRSSGNVPLYVKATEGMKANFALDSERCWQSAETIRSDYLDAKAAEMLETSARNAFVTLEKQGSEKGALRLLPAAEKLSAVKSAAAGLFQEIEKRAGR